ncbi:hypothetical protein IEQ34_010636 [Dendrobium chrysotoxum]|uniref:Meiosis-specific protein ASY3-like coiled-coil domain-containing protein n=1 Tax=Dendrobium chrysotoxum TaxID=161865 RepID=A0AAV7GWB8_DENCH|nr:hypothetical protein IEQ34_010636 [Dendrobium chrysotoxum]
MLEIRSQKVGHSDCRSLGSNQHQSGRSAKASIGITVEKSPTVASGVGKEDAPALHSAEIHSSGKGMGVGEQSRPHGEVNSETTKVELKGQKNSECLPSRSSCCKTSNADASKFYVNQLPVLPSVVSTHKKVVGLAYEHDREQRGDAYLDQGLTFASMKKTNLLDQEISGEPTVQPYKSTTDGLKMKLWEILGGAPSQKENIINSKNIDTGKENVCVEYNRGLQKGRVARPKPSSDPIETDSDSPNQTIRRPATRSMTRKKISDKIGKKLDDALNNGKKPLSSTCSDCKHKAKENLRGSGDENIFFSFGRDDQRMQNQSVYAKSEADIEFRKISGSISDMNPNVQTNFKCKDKEDIFSFALAVGNKRTSVKSANEKRNAAIEKETIYVPNLSSSKSTLQKNEKKKSFPSAKVLQSMNDIETSPCMSCPSKTQSMQPKTAQNDSQNSQMNAQNLSGIPFVLEAVAYENTQSSLLKKEKRSCGPVNSSAMLKFASQHDKATRSPVTSSADTTDDLQSPTLAGKVTTATSSRPSNEIVGSPLQSRKIEFTWNFNNSDILDNKPRSGGSGTNTESSDDTREVYESRDEDSTFMDGNETKEQLSLSPKARHDSDSFGAEELKIKGFRQTRKWFPSVDNLDKTPLKLHKRRRVHGPKDAKLRDETNDLYEASEQSVEDSLARAVSQLALALRRINSKIQLHTSKKSCEIISAVAEKIKQQLQDFDSKIQEDMGKFNGASKSKRKHLESRFEEHQERLGLIHEKYKEDFNHQLLNCSSTLEELEAQNVEIKVTADRQKVLHRKLLLQIEETMKDQLNVAETSITAIRKDARKRLNSLKFALKEWLSDGAIS